MSKRPWRRFWARTFDYLLVMAIFVLLLDWFLPLWRSFWLLNLLWISFLAMLAWIPIEGWTLHRFGTTPGKALLGIRIEGLEIKRSRQRAYLVWLRGMGCGIFLVSQLFQIIAYRQLMREGITSWDAELHTEQHYADLTLGRIIWFVALFIAVEATGVGLFGAFARRFLMMEAVDLKWR